MSSSHQLKESSPNEDHDKNVKCNQRNVAGERRKDHKISSREIIGAEREIADGKESSMNSGKGVPFVEIRQGHGRWGPPPLPPVKPSSSHTVLYKVPWRLGQMPDPYPSNPYDRWDQDHVRMPHSAESLYPVQEADDEKGLRMRWELVQESLLRNIMSSHQLESAILSYNSRYNEKWNFSALHSLFNEVLEKEETDFFFSEILPTMIALALQLPDLVPGPIPLLKKHKNHTISLLQVQVASLLANAFFCTFPRRNSMKRGSEYANYPDINFHRLFQCGDGDSSSNKVMEKLKCILNYFRRICGTAPEGVVTFSRRHIPPGSFPDFGKSTKPLPKLHIRSSGFIEDEGSGMLQVDFANKYIGGGVLGWGCVQEEIRFVVCPELIISRLFTECLDTTEALVIVGCERFSNYSGYGHTFEWIGDFQDETPLDTFGRRHCSIVAMDALCFSNASSQFSLPNLIREVNKAYVGFCEPNHYGPLAPVATGNWGCGAFRGDANLKALIQLVAAGQAGRSLVYFTFGDENLRDRIYRMYKFLVEKSINVGKLWTLLCEYSRKLSLSSSSDIPDLYEFLYSHASGDSQDQHTGELKPSLSLKRKDPATKAKSNTSDSSANTSSFDDSSRHLAGTGLTEEDLDSLIEEFDSDAEPMDETSNSEPSKRSDHPKVSSISCLDLIEESLQKGKVKETDSSRDGKGLSKSAMLAPKKNSKIDHPHEKDSSSVDINVQSGKDNEMDSSHSKNNVDNVDENDKPHEKYLGNSKSKLQCDSIALSHDLEAMDTSEVSTGPTSVRSEEDLSQSAPSSSSQSSVNRSKPSEASPSGKRSSAPKRKISDYYSVV